MSANFKSLHLTPRGKQVCSVPGVTSAERFRGEDMLIQTCSDSLLLIFRQASMGSCIYSTFGRLLLHVAYFFRRLFVCFVPHGSFDRLLYVSCMLSNSSLTF